MSSLVLRLGSFVVALALAFAAAFTIGTATEPVAQRPAVDRDEGPAHGGEHGSPQAPASTGALPGLAVSTAGYTLAPAGTSFHAGPAVPFRFTVTGPDGQALTSYRTTHEKDLHLIVVRRDLTGFQHVHPTLGRDGAWSVPLDLPEGGAYRVFADFAPEQRTDPLTLGTDIFVSGDFAPDPLPVVSPVDTVDGYTVRLDGAPGHGDASVLRFTVTKDGAEVTDLEPYLGAFGHLVSLRVGDLAYQHTHPGQDAGPGQRGGPAVEFSTEFPTAGAYRLFLDFRIGGVVRTAAFTVVS